LSIVAYVPRVLPTRRRTALVLAVVLALVAGAGVLLLLRERSRDGAAEDAARTFARAATEGELSGGQLLQQASAEAHEEIVAGLEVQPQVQVLRVQRDGGEGAATLRWRWPFGPDGWSYETRLPLVETEQGWAVRWSPQVVHPELEPGTRLDAERTAPARGEVLGRDGRPLVTDRPVVEVGVQPSRADDVAGLSRRLAELLDVDAAALEQRIRAASPDAFVPVIVLRRTDYEPLRAQLQPLPGTVFRESELPLAPTRAFARALVGSAGPATAELVEQSGGRIAAGDVTGLSGLQRTYDEVLAGTAGVRVDRARGQQRDELFAVPPVAGRDVGLTLDERVQTAADAALATAAGGNGNASLVAIDVPTGDVLAVANTPVTGADRATTGRYPPGSTFKTATAYALLGDGFTADETVGCPATVSVDGRSFRNFEGGALGDVPFRQAFAESCNTAFVQLTQRLDPSALPPAGLALGIGVPWSVGVDVFAGDVPVPDGPVELAAQGIGQGEVLASPAAMAQAAATIARGSWRAPRLVVEPAPQAAAAAPPETDPARLATLRELMRAVVAGGTAQALADVPGDPVHAKTGTAEFGTQTPPQTHAWTIGFAGPVAFAVLVEEGRSGGSVAVPVAEAFLRALA
jgi:cell division protein FtsI/penicillin-binding protein 2